MKKLLLIFFLVLSANAKWVMFSTVEAPPRIFIYNDETGEVFERLPLGGFIRERFGDYIDTSNNNFAFPANARDTPTIKNPKPQRKE